MGSDRINPDDLTAVSLKLSRALERSDAERIRDLTDWISHRWYRISYDQQNIFRPFIPSILSIFWDRMPFQKFRNVMNLSIFDPGDIFAFFGSMARYLSTDTIIRILESFDIPGEDEETEAFTKEVSQRSDPSITDFLIQKIGIESSKFNNDSFTPFSHHDRTMSSFGYLYLKPDDSKLAEYLKLLSKRDDPRVKPYLIRLLKELPWGEDRYTTVILLDIMSKKSCREYHEALIDVLGIRSEFTQLRLYLIQTLFEYSREHAFRIIYEDLSRSGMSFTARTRYLSDLEEMLHRVEPKIKHETVPPYETPIDTTDWSFLHRGHLAAILASHYPDLSRNQNAGFLDRFGFGLCRAFQTVRIDHMGCGCVLPLLFSIFWVIKGGADRFIGQPKTPANVLIYFLMIIWIMVVAATSRTHFSGHENPKDIFVMALVFWLSLLLFLGVSAGVYLHLLSTGH